MKVMRKRLLNSKGTTLVEILVSVFLLAMVLLGLIRLYYMSAYQINLARHKTMAVNLAQATLEDLISTGYAGIVTASYPSTSTVTIDPGKTDLTTDDLSGTMTTTLSNLNVNEGYKFIITITWNEKYTGTNRSMTEVVECLVTNHED